MSIAEQKTIFSFFGPPGSGKGTLASSIVSELGFSFLSTGDLCRKHVSSGTELGKSLDEYIRNGILIPDDLITKMVTQWLSESLQTTEKSVILDGYPRTKGQATGLLSYMRNDLKDYNFRVFFITLDDEEIIKRLTSRKVCENKECQAIYAAGYDKDTCEKCEAVVVRRSDDAENVVRSRLKAYPVYRDALMDFYKQSGVVVETLDMAGISKEQALHTFKAML